jgi:hypothetical protein
VLKLKPYHTRFPALRWLSGLAILLLLGYCNYPRGHFQVRASAEAVRSIIGDAAAAELTTVTLRKGDEVAPLVRQLSERQHWPVKVQFVVESEPAHFAVVKSGRTDELVAEVLRSAHFDIYRATSSSEVMFVPY